MIATALDINNVDSITAAMQPNIPSQVVGPDSNGEFPSPLEGALWMAGIYQIPQIPLNGKAPFFPEWPTKASFDPTQIRAWWDQYHGNFGSLAVPGKHFIFETDSPAVRERFKTISHDFTAKLIIESRQGEHRYYLSASGVENVAQSAVEHGDFSIRANAEQCVSPGSIHPITGKQYRVASTGRLTAPTPQEISFWASERKEKTSTIHDAQAMIRDGQRNSTLMSLAGKYLDLGEDPERVKERIQEINSERCSSPLSEDELSKTIFASIDRYAKNPDSITRKMREIIPVLGKAGNAEPKGRTMQFVRGDSIQPKRVRWLWRGRILADKLNVFSGEPDVGKGMTTVDLAARLTRHLDFPDGKNELDGPKDVVFLSSEDDMEDTIVPRLIVAGADMKRIHFVQISENSTGTLEEGIVCLDRDLPCLEEIVKLHPDIVLIIPDPVIAFLGDADPNKDKDVRPIYSKMKAFAKRLNVGWLFVNHWNKNQTASSINRTSGAKTMVSAPRATWMFTRSPEDPTRYLMMKGKGNLAGNAKKTLAYRIIGVPYDFQDGQAIDPDGVPKLVWDGETDHSTEDVLKDQNDPKMRHNSKAEELLSTLLKDGAMRAKEVYQAGDKEKLDDNQMQRARYKLGYVAARIDGAWYWAKSDEDIVMRKQRLYTPHPGTLSSEPADVDFNARVN
jgi:AAA domain/Bifunctional DNA primase/polymerase, N-terminal/Primase C terminal 1 (PriCT-1)